MKTATQLLTIATIVAGLSQTSQATHRFDHPLIPTPEQTVGPFYPRYKAFEQADNNMSNTEYKPTHWPVDDEPRTIANSKAKGQLLRIEGHVVDLSGNAISNAEVQFWQTDADQGRYLSEQTDKPLDPHFDYVGKTHSKTDGSWSIATVRPKEYEADVDWTRPDHVHVRVFIGGQLKLTTQLYFSDDQELIAKDPILQALTPEQQQALIVELRNVGVQNELTGHFHIVLNP